MITEATIHWVTQDLNAFATRSDTGEQIYIPVPICMAAGITPDSIGDDIEVKVVRNAASNYEDKTPWRAVRVSVIDRGETPAPEPELEPEPIDLTEEEVNRIRSYVDANLTIEGDLRRDVQNDIKRKIEIGCHQGVRHRKGLPVRGQRTHTNARTRKGPKRTVANKKKAVRK